MSKLSRETVVGMIIQFKQANHRQWRYLYVLICALALSACQVLPEQQSEQKAGGKVLQKNAKGQFFGSDFEKIEELRGQVSAWQLTGSFSYIDPQDTGAGRIKWDFQGALQAASTDNNENLESVDRVENEKVRLIGPIGTGSLELISSDSSAILIAGRERYVGADVESLLLKTVGWRLPVDELRFWLFGMPSPTNEGRYWLNEQGLLQSLKQSDWEIQFDRYQLNSFPNQPLPQKITAVHRGNQAKIKLVIKQFKTQ